MLWIKKHKAAVCLLLAALCAVSVGVNFNALWRNPLESAVAISDPSGYTHDAGSGRQYVVMEGAREIAALNGEREYMFSIQGGKRTRGYYNAQEAVVGGDGYLYVHDQVKNENGKEIESERIAKYDASGRFLSYVFEWSTSTWMERTGIVSLA